MQEFEVRTRDYNLLMCKLKKDPDDVPYMEYQSGKRVDKFSLKRLNEIVLEMTGNPISYYCN